MVETKLESVVIVTNQYGSVATIRFNTDWHDKIFSSSSKPTLYTLVENYVKEVLNG